MCLPNNGQFVLRNAALVISNVSRVCLTACRKTQHLFMSISDHDALWHEQFVQELARLRAVLGELTAGGVVEQAQHIGATSVPGLSAIPCIDIGLAVWPFPLAIHQREVLQELGYELIAGEEKAVEQRFKHASGAFQLFVTEAGHDGWTNYMLLRDYLRDNEGARRILSAQKQARAQDALAYAQWKAHALPGLVETAHTWWINRQSFEPVELVTAELKDYAGFWAISSGWALDLYLGRVTRVHHDVDVVVSYGDQVVLQHHLSDRGWKLLAPFEGRLEPWPPEMILELPRHQVHAHRAGAFIDCLLSDVTNGLWHYRRDPAVIRQLDRAVLRSTVGIPFLAPELVLLFKSKNTSFNQRVRSQDQLDFNAVQSHLEAERRAWLRWALSAIEPEHPWIEPLI